MKGRVTARVSGNHMSIPGMELRRRRLTVISAPLREGSIGMGANLFDFQLGKFRCVSVRDGALNYPPAALFHQLLDLASDGGR